MTDTVKTQILLVEDREEWCNRLCRILEEEYDVTIACNLSAARAQLKSSTPFDVIVVDPILDDRDSSNRDGFELIKELDGLARNVPVIVLTGYSTEKDAHTAYKNLKADNYLAKPSIDGTDIDCQELFIALREAVASKKAFALVLLPLTHGLKRIHQDMKGEIEKTCSLEYRIADDFWLPISIMSDINRSILDAELVIADLTGRNPNVLYEVGISHAKKIPTLLLTQHMEEVPGVLGHLRHIVYENSATGVKTLKNIMGQHIQKVRAGRKRLDVFDPGIRGAEENPNECLVLVSQNPDGENVLRQIIEPAVTDIFPAMQCLTTEGIFGSGSMIDAMVRNVITARIIITDITSCDPAVFYELGLSHGLGKKVILLAESQVVIPFDLRDRSCLRYKSIGYAEQLAAQDRLKAVLKQL